MSDKTSARRKRRPSDTVQDFVDGVATIVDLTGSLTEPKSRRHEKNLRVNAAKETSRREAGVAPFTKRVGAFLNRAGIVAEREGYDVKAEIIRHRRLNPG